MPPRQGRAVVLVNVAISGAIIAVIAGVSVFRAPATTPTIQEFAPANPGRQLTDEASPEPTTARSFATGPLTRPTKATGVPSALRCWQWPDGSTTQTFDRQSPPCISSWDAAKGNGGATSRGVTRSEIRVGLPVASVSAWQPLATFFSRHYQLYGRTIRLVPLGIGDFATADGQRAAAASAAEHGVFATLDDPTTGGEPADLGVYLDALARAHVIGVVTRSSQMSTTALAAEAPYGWSVVPPLDTLQHVAGTAVCRELSGHRASHSKQRAGQTRRFAALVPASRVNGGRTYDVGALSSALGQCHQSAQVLEYDPNDPHSLDARLVSARTDGVTTLLPFGGASTVASVLMRSASRLGYQPEWFVPGLTQQQSDWKGAPGEQVRSLFGLASWAKPLPSSHTPAAQALREVAPGARLDSTTQRMYDGLALIAAGIQVAGEQLKPETFADGLETTSFANPGAGRAPQYQARVGFQDVDHTMVDDVAQVWWHSSGFCYVDRGRRWAADDLPFADPGFFDTRHGC